MKLWLVTRKAFLEMLREPQTLILVVLFPLGMMMITVFGYGTAPRLKTHPIAVIEDGAASQAMVQTLVNAAYDNGKPMFDMRTDISREQAEAALKDGSVAVLLDLTGAQYANKAPVIKGDATSMAFTNATTLLGQVMSPWLREQAGKISVIRYAVTPLSSRAPETDFDAYAPGMMILAVLFLIPNTAMILGREVRWGTLGRLRLTRLSTAEMLGGVTASQMMIAVPQVLLMLGGALLFGFHPQGSMLLALVISLGLGFSSIGFGLLVASFSRNDSEAVNIGAVFTMVQVFMCGAFFAMPTLPLFNLMDHQFGVFDFLPATQAMQAMQMVLARGAGWDQVRFRFILMLVLSLIYFAVGVWVFQRAQMKARR